jgi:glycosyltransferase involved in cell wall biosynthesis
MIKEPAHAGPDRGYALESGKTKIELSIVAPVYNEEGNIAAFHEELSGVLRGLGRAYEVVYVDDGSRDRSLELLKGFAAADPRVRVISFTRNFGQTAAIAAAIANSAGAIVIPMDADMQNDPHDIPRFLEKIEEGYDVVSGWRRHRKDPWLSKKLPSAMANKLISFIGGLPLHDYGCSMKAYRRDIIRHVRLYGEMHRFIPLFAHQVGARTAEIEVNHRPRTAGKSNYGLMRIYKVTLDLITVKYLNAYATKPIYFFGSMGALLSGGGVLFGFWALYDRYFKEVYVHRNPKILLAIFLFILGFQFIMLGVLAELLMRTYYESQKKDTFFIREKFNFIGKPEDDS